MKERLSLNQKTFMEKLEEKKHSWETDLAGLIQGQLPSFEQAGKEITHYLK